MPFFHLHWYLPLLHGMAIGLVAMASHEAAHIVAALALGIKVKRVGLGWKGIYTVRDSGPPGKNMLVSLAGPAMNLVLLPFWHLLPIFGLANLCCGVVNLLPIEGSDGLRALRLWRQIQKKDGPV